jgi:hypothetical protein
MRLWSILHATFARLHGGMREEPLATNATGTGQSNEFKKAYAEYASATALANVMLQEHGAGSPQFASADVASMRLFHRVKKMQGLRKPRNS